MVDPRKLYTKNSLSLFAGSGGYLFWEAFRWVVETTMVDLATVALENEACFWFHRDRITVSSSSSSSPASLRNFGKLRAPRQEFALEWILAQEFCDFAFPQVVLCVDECVLPQWFLQLFERSVGIAGSVSWGKVPKEHVSLLPLRGLNGFLY